MPALHCSRFTVHCSLFTVHSSEHCVASSIPIKSLTYKCLSKLATIESEPSPRSFLGLQTDPFNSSDSSDSSDSSSPSSPSSSYSSLSSSSPSSTHYYPSQAFPTAPLGFQNTPIIIRQYIVDYVTRKGVKISCQYLCDLLSDGGCYSIDLWELSDFNLFGETEMTKILSTMDQNCNNLRSLSLGGQTCLFNTGVINGPMRNLFKNNTLTKLRCLKLQQTSSPEELITILSSCPNLVRLEIMHHSLTDKQVASVYKELQSPVYNQIRSSLRDLRLPSSVRGPGLIRMINLFPNLVFLNCCHYGEILKAIESGRLTNKIYGDYDVTELQSAAAILANLRGLTVTQSMGRDEVHSLVTLSPNLQELDFQFEIDAHMYLFPIANLKYLARLALKNSLTSPASFLQQVLPLLQQIGNHLQALELEGFDVVDLTTCARHCPNLRHFSCGWFTFLSSQSTSGLTLSKQERANLRRPFSHLETLRLRPRDNVGVKAIVYILTNATNIESIEIYSCPDLTDEQLIELTKNNSLRNLRSLILRHGHSLSKSCLDQFVDSLDNLSFLDCGAPLLSKAELH